MLLSEKWRTPTIIGIRFIQLLSIGTLISGFLWATADWMLLKVLVESPVTPLSVLMMLYGTLGTFITEAVARWLGRESHKPTKK